MLPLFKKNDKAKTTQSPAWHLNFRNFAALPDTKIVRTSFYINGALALLAILSVMAFVYQEFNISELESQLDGIQHQITLTAPASAKALDQYKKFQAEEQKTQEVDSFLKSQKLVLSEFSIHLDQSKPQAIVFLSITYSELGVTIKAYAQGTPEQGASFASAYEKQLKEDPSLRPLFKSISMANVSRDTQANRMLFDIIMSFGISKGK